MSDGPFFLEEDDNPFQNIVIPMIKKVIPNIITSDICAIQPLAYPSGAIFTHRYSEMREEIIEALQEPTLTELINEVFP